jgi:hypothetical protein
MCLPIVNLALSLVYVYMYFGGDLAKVVVEPQEVLLFHVLVPVALYNNHEQQNDTLDSEQGSTVRCLWIELLT